MVFISLTFLLLDVVSSNFAFIGIVGYNFGNRALKFICGIFNGDAAIGRLGHRFSSFGEIGARLSNVSAAASVACAARCVDATSSIDE